MNTKLKVLLTTLVCTLGLLTANGQLLYAIPGTAEPAAPFEQPAATRRAFNHLDLSLTTGSTGIGFDVAMPLNDVLSLRAGYAVMPHLTHTMHFGVEVGDDPEKSESKFNRLSGLLEGFTGYKVDNVVDMNGQPTYWNWKLMVDVKPFRNKHWHLTAGVYYGSREVAKAANTMEDMPSLMAVGIYNNLYRCALEGKPLAEVNGTNIFIQYPLDEKLVDYGRMSIHIGDYKRDVLYEEDVIATEKMYIGDNIIEPGDVLHHAGEVKHAKGDAYRMVPDENSMVKAWAYANRWKPYVGFGYGGRLLKNDDRWQVSMDCGAMFWGGTPQIVTHDGTDLVNDVENVRGRVGDYVDIIRKFKVFPVLNLRLSWRLF